MKAYQSDRIISQDKRWQRRQSCLRGNQSRCPEIFSSCEIANSLLCTYYKLRFSTIVPFWRDRHETPRLGSSNWGNVQLAMGDDYTTSVSTRDSRWDQSLQLVYRSCFTLFCFTIVTLAFENVYLQYSCTARADQFD